MNTNHPKPARDGSAVLLCTLAAAVLSLSAMAILRASAHSRSRIEGARASATATQTATGLIARATALSAAGQLPTDGIVRDRTSSLPDAYATAINDGTGRVTISVYLYAGSVHPAHQTIVDLAPPVGTGRESSRP